MVNMSGGKIEFAMDFESSTDDAMENDNDDRERNNLMLKSLCRPYAYDDSNVGGEPMLYACAEVRLENGESLMAGERVGWNEKVEKVVGVEKSNKKGCKKPPRPPRHSCPLALDPADQKLIREISELAMLKKARAERIKALKKIKSGNAASYSTVSIFAMTITLIFCVVVFWQGAFPRGGSTSAIRGPVSSGSYISSQLYKNTSPEFSAQP